MSVRIWLGDAPEEGYERSALRELASSLSSEAGDFDILANFTVGAGRDSKQIDILVIHGKAWTILELKHSAGYAVFGKANGPWQRSDGVKFPGHNPAQQIVKQYSALKSWLHGNYRDFIDRGRQAACRDQAAWTDIRKFIVLYPCKNPTSKIDVQSCVGLSGTLGDVIGFDLVKDHLLEPKWQGCLRMEVTQEEIERLARLLGLQDKTATILAPGSAKADYLPYEAPDGAPDSERGTSPPARLAGQRRRWLIAIPVLLVLGTLLAFVFWPRAQVIEATEAWQFIGQERQFSIRIQIGRIAENGRDRLVYDARIPRGSERNFSVEINNVADGYLRFTAGDTIVVGPAEIGRSGSGNAQVEIEYRDVDSLVKLER